MSQPFSLFRIRKILLALKSLKTNQLHPPPPAHDLFYQMRTKLIPVPCGSHMEIVSRLASCSCGVQWVVLALPQWHPSPQVPSGTPPLPPPQVPIMAHVPSMQDQRSAGPAVTVFRLLAKLASCLKPDYPSTGTFALKWACAHCKAVLSFFSQTRHYALFPRYLVQRRKNVHTVTRPDRANFSGTVSIFARNFFKQKLP